MRSFNFSHPPSTPWSADFNIDIILQFRRYRRRRCVVFDKTCRQCTHVSFIPHVNFHAQKSACRATVAQKVSPQKHWTLGAASLWRFRPSFQLFRLHILSYNSPISRFCPSGDASYGERAIHVSYAYNIWHYPRSERPPTLVAYNAMEVLDKKFPLQAVPLPSEM